MKNTKPTQSKVTKTPIKTDLLFKKSIVKTESFNETVTKKTLLKTASKSAFKQKLIQQKTIIFDSEKTEINQKTKYHNTVFSNIKLDSVDRKSSQTQVLNLIKADSVDQKNTQLIDSVKNLITKSNIKKDVVKTVSVKKTTQKLSKFGLSLYAGPHVNFAKGSNTLLSFGAGIAADFALNKKLKFETGLGLTQNKLSYQSNSNNSLYALNSAYQSAINTQNTNINSTTLTSLNASLLQLDVPINLVYQILPGKNSIAILAGLSSGVFTKESYQYNYVNAANNSQVSKSFQNFYLLKTLNLAAQIGLPIKKYNLQVEPFVKVPLGNMATQQLKFGAAGINLKFNFLPIKK
ncbi:MAG: hypothetical protein EOP43_05465 [Sphingobacteriaceae bacterium]|nr:MAG: hypothetical protein EOP43_05465 [Sphingobacteriaceae bacterium]